MPWQIAYEPENEPRSYSLYELSHIKEAPKIWRKSFETEAAAHRWVKENYPATNVR